MALIDVALLAWAPGWAWALAFLSALMIGLLRVPDPVRYAPFAQARLERGQNEVTVVVPPRPGARSFVLIWTFSLAALSAHALMLCRVHFTPLGSLAFVAWVLFLAAGLVPYVSEIEIFPWYIVLGADGHVRIAHPIRWRTVERASLHAQNQHSEISVQRGEAGTYIHYPGYYETTHAVCARLSKDDAETLLSLGARDGTSAPCYQSRWSLVGWMLALSLLLFCAVGAYGLASVLVK